MCRRIKLLDEIDLVIEIAIRLATYEDAPFVVLLNIRSPIEIGIYGDQGQLAIMVVQTPDIGRFVAIPIIDANVLGVWPERSDRCCTHTDGQEHREPPK